MVTDFGHRTDGGARCLDGVALFDGNGWGNPFDTIDLWFVHPVKKLTGVRCEGLDVASLSFRIEGVKGKRAFSGSAQSSDDDQLAQWQIQVEMLQIVLSHTAKLDEGISLGPGHEHGNVSQPQGLSMRRSPPFLTLGGSM